MSADATDPPHPGAPDFQSLFQAAPGNYLVLDRDFNIVAVSDAYVRATLGDRTEMVGRSVFAGYRDSPSVSAADGIALLRSSLERVLGERRVDVLPTQKYDIPLPEAAGGGFEERYWKATNAPVLGPDREVAWIIHLAEDVTEQVQREQSLEEQRTARANAETALRQAQKMEALGQLTGGIAHDFNNLLTVVGGSIDLIRSNPDDSGRVHRLADSAMTAIERCERLIKQLLMFSRKQVMRPETMNPNRLIADFTTLISRATSEHIELATRLSPLLHPVRLDPAQFESAILNLVVNAREAISGAGRITIETENVELGPNYAGGNSSLAPGSYVLVAVSDTGRGIPAELLGRVFDPFFTTKEIGKGSGLGLSQVYGFVKESGGHVTIYSEIGAGTTVRIYLPRSTDAQAAPEPPDNVLPLRRTRSGETVLVVEDDEPVLKMAVESLKELGYRVLTAQDAAQALAILQGDDSIDILFSDVVMPGGMNGVQLAVETRRLRPRVKVLLTSGYTAAALAAQHGLEANLPLLEKPYRPHELAARFRVIANGR